ncbi:MAG: hypothetical protein ACRDNS_02165 [Trebonia sp.]
MPTPVSSDLRMFIASVREVGATAPATLRRELRSAASMVAAEARRISSEHSTTIPATIRTSVQPSRGRAAVLAGGKGATHGLARRMFTAGYGTARAERAYAGMQREAAGNVIAGLYEYGNKDRGPHATTFRHPTFGDREDWQEQPRYPFLQPAAQHKAAEWVAQTSAVVERWVRVIADSR